jgi:hypothetical protein
MVGRRHQRETGASQSTGWGCQEIPDRICGTLSSRRSSANHQQSLRTQKFAANHNQHALGALLSRRAASQSIIHTGCVHNLRKEWDCPTLGQSATRTSQDCRGRAVATSDRSGGWDQSQNQVRDVGFVFACRSVGVLWPQSHLFRHTGGNRGQARPEHRRAYKRQASEISFSFVTRTGQTWFGRTGVSGSVTGVSRRCLGYTSRRTRGATLAVVRFREHEHQRPTLVLLASRWKPEEHKNGSVCKTAADASKPKAFLAGVEITKPLQQTGRFRFPFRTTARHQAVRSSFSPEEENSACIQTDRNYGCVGWHTFRHSVGSMLAEMGEHQLTIRDYLRHSNLHVTNKYLQATSKTKRLAQDKLVDAILPTGILPKTNLIQ